MNMPQVLTGTMAASGLLLGLAALPVAGRSQTALAEDVAYFESKVRPLLIENCFSCHGAKNQMGGLRLDSRAAILKGGTDGLALVPGDPESSALIKAVRYAGSLKMPPTGKLSADQIATLTTWVKRGAVWPQERSASPAAALAPYIISEAKRNFWSFRPVRKPPVPKVKLSAWVKTPIDAFILAELEKKGLTPAPPADRRTLIRRATYDLTGLPPTPAEIDSFLADRSPNAFTKVVDRLLASPRYGERWGRHWLDVVRYCDSLDARGLGSEGDISEAWRYRDWVVKAFNADMPYSEFMMNQVAGDLLPASTPGDLNRDGTIATGMLAIGNWGNGDADKEKILTDIADDQVDVVSRGFMGLTVGCARCHDHKFDPIPTRDYYGLAGIFFSTHILPKLTPKGAGETPLRIPLVTKADRERSEKYIAQMAALDQREAEARKALASRMLPETARYATAAWDYAHRPPAEASLSLADFAARQGLYAYALRQWTDVLGLGEYRLMTTPIRDLLGNAGVDVWKGSGDTPSATINTTATARTILTFTLPPRSVCVHPGPTNGVVVGWKSPITGTVRLTGGVTDADPAGGDGIAWIVDHRAGGAPEELASGDFPNGGAQGFAQGKGAEHLASIPVRTGDEIQLLVLPKENHTCDTTAVHFTITQEGTGRIWDLAQDLVDDPLQNGKGNPHSDRYGNPAVWRFYDMADNDRARKPAVEKDLALLAWKRVIDGEKDHDAVARASAVLERAFTPTDSRSPFWLRAPEDVQALPAAAKTPLAQVATGREALQKQAPPPIEYANGAQDGGVPESSQAGFHDVHIHIRGSYLRLSDLAPRHFPIVLAGEHQTPITQGSGRLDLARWLANANHPLTPRVIVNRIWQHHFGEGIVRTPSNFGFLGERPTHPELLDWLAANFVEESVKRQALSVKKLAEEAKRGAQHSTLNTQRSTLSSSFACGWSMKKLHRLIMLSAVYQQSSVAPARALKLDPDNRLLGRMSRRRLESEAIRDSLLAASGTLDATMGGPAVRDFQSPRRSLYIMTIRSDRAGFGPLFDVADSTAIVDRRVVSTVAPQALFLLNNTFALQQTKGLAQRLATLTGDDSSRIRYAYPILYGRPASEAELHIGLKFLARMRASLLTYRGDPSPRTAAYESGASPEQLRAWEAYCQILLCANEFIYVD